MVMPPALFRLRIPESAEGESIFTFLRAPGALTALRAWKQLVKREINPMFPKHIVAKLLLHEKTLVATIRRQRKIPNKYPL